MHFIVNCLNWLRRKIRDECGFTYAETNGMIVLLLLMSVCLAMPFVIKWYSKTYHYPKYEMDIALLNTTLAALHAQQPTKARPKAAAKSIGKDTFLAKKQMKVLNEAQKTNPPLTPIAKTKQERVFQTFNINTATPQALQALPGIGDTLANRIVKYKNQLGGFVTQDQYREVYGIGALALKHLMLYSYIESDFRPQQLSINEADFKTLLRHPYLSYEQVKKILKYREKNGAFKDIDSLLQKELIDQNTFKKLCPYLKL